MLSCLLQEKLAELLQKHRQQKQQTVAMTKDLPDKVCQHDYNYIYPPHFVRTESFCVHLVLGAVEQFLGRAAESMVIAIRH